MPANEDPQTAQTWKVSRLMVVGVEGTGVYGAGLARRLSAAGCGWSRLIGRIARAADSPASPIRWTLRRRRGRRSRRSAPEPRKTVTGQVEALRALRVARRSAVDQRADCQRRIKALIVTAPDARRERLRRLPLHELLEVCAGLRPDLDRAGDPEQATKLALRQLARRHAALSAEIHELDNVLPPLVEQINPRLVALNGVGTDVAGQLLVTAGQNSETAPLRGRLRHALRRRADPGQLG